MNDLELVSRCLKGDIRAQEQLYAVYAPKLMGICMRYSASHEEAKDMLQETFIRIFTKLKQFKQDGPLGAWIRRVAVNTAAEIYRRDKKLRNNQDIDHHPHMVHQSVDILDSLAVQSIMDKVKSLPDGYRVVFNLFAVEGYSHKEIGEMLGISENTSKSQYCRARNSLKQMIEQELKQFHARVG